MDRLLEATYHAEQHHFWFVGFRRFVVPVLARAASGRRDLRLLDAGCGTGLNLTLLSAHGTAFGLDLTWLGLAYGARRGATRLVQASITDIPFASGSFDIVTSFDVLQTLTHEQEAQALRDVARVLRPGGALLLNVAALEWLRGSHSALAQEHHRHSKASLRAALEAAGFAIERITYTNVSLFPLVLAVRLAQRLTRRVESGRAKGREIQMPIAPINRTLSALVATEAALARHVNMPIGSSVLCLARKPAR